MERVRSFGGWYVGDSGEIYRNKDQCKADHRVRRLTIERFPMIGHGRVIGWSEVEMVIEVCRKEE